MKTVSDSSAWCNFKFELHDVCFDLLYVSFFSEHITGKDVFFFFKKTKNYIVEINQA